EEVVTVAGEPQIKRRIPKVGVQIHNQGLLAEGTCEQRPKLRDDASHPAAALGSHEGQTLCFIGLKALASPPTNAGNCVEQLFAPHALHQAFTAPRPHSINDEYR